MINLFKSLFKKKDCGYCTECVHFNGVRDRYGNLRSTSTCTHKKVGVENMTNGELYSINAVYARIIFCGEKHPKYFERKQ